MLGKKVRAVGLRKALMEEIVEFAKEAMGLVDDAMVSPEEGPGVDRETMELAESLLEPM